MPAAAGAPGAARGPAAALIEWAGDGRRAVLCCDFDGTLAPIVADPDTAAPVPGTVEVLAALASKLGRVAVVSGRPASYLADRVPTPGVVLAGLYGLERVVDGRVERAASVEAWVPVVTSVADGAEAGAPAGLRVERKGVTVALHWRQAPGSEAWAVGFADEQAVATGLIAHPGKMSVELRPPIGGDKGDVVTDLGEGAEAVSFLGDDVGDLPAFAAVDRLAATGARGLKVAVGGAEAPADLVAQADVVAGDPAAVLAALRALATALA